MNKGALIVETRYNNVLDIAVNKHMKFLPEDWGLKIIGGDKVSINSLNDYNKLMTSLEFWENVPFDKVLIFQSDSELLRTGIEEFLQYDYVGSPWKFQNHGGNGGLSLRSKQAMIDIINKYPYQGASVHGYEDVYFCNHLRFEGNLAPREVCKKFACEAIFEMGTMGVHAIDKYLTKQECNKIRTQYNG